MSQKLWGRHAKLDFPCRIFFLGSLSLYLLLPVSLPPLNAWRRSSSDKRPEGFTRNSRLKYKLLSMLNFYYQLFSWLDDSSDRRVNVRDRLCRREKGLKFSGWECAVSRDDRWQFLAKTLAKAHIQASNSYYYHSSFVSATIVILVYDKGLCFPNQGACWSDF